MSTLSRQDCARLDRDDPFAGFRDRFDLPDGILYLDGNSLGALPHKVRARLARVVDREWGQDLIGSWNKADWISLPQRVGGRIARLIGAEEHEVVCADSTSINVFKLAAGALALRPDRRTIVTEAGSFPTDVYMLEGLAGLLGDRADLKLLPRDEVLDAVDDTTAVLLLTHVHYRTGEVWDMAAVTAHVHAAGALMLWDLSHSTGALEVDLNGTRADLATGCGYKYLNGGPGAPAYLFVADRHQADFTQPLSGWMGHARPFDFDDRYHPAAHIGRMTCGTPPVLGLSALDAALDLFDDVNMAALRAKSRQLGDLFIDLVEQRCSGHGLSLACPRDSARRGSQVSFRHDEGYAIVQALIRRGVIGDFRMPDVARFGFAPLYLRFVDIWDAVDHLAQILSSGEWDDATLKTKATVT